MSRRFLLLNNEAQSLLRFRGDLLKAIVERGHTVIASCPAFPQEDAALLQSWGIQTDVFPLQRTGLNPFADAVSLREIASLLSRHRPDVLLSTTIKPVIYGSMAASLVGIPMICSMITGLGYAFLQGSSLQGRMLHRLVRRMYRVALARNHTVFFQNPDDQGLFLSEGIIRSPEQACLIPGSGVDTQRFLPKPLPQGPMTFLLIARLLRDKGIFEYAEAARLLKARYPDVRFHLLGPLDQNPASVQPSDLETWKREGIVTYLGETKDVRPFLTDAHVCVLPSYREGTPRSLLEALAIGRPLVTTDVPGCREVLREGVNGFLVPSHDPRALAAGMERFLLSPDLLLPMSFQSRKMAEDIYDVRRVNRLLLDRMGL